MATPTIEPVIIITIFISSICCKNVISKVTTFLIIISKVFTIANPEKTAPATVRRENGCMPSWYYRCSKVHRYNSMYRKYKG
jgi:hypothetical protein